MFTGIVRGIGEITEAQKVAGDLSLVIETRGILASSRTEVGASIAVNGVCLTLTEWMDSRFRVDVSRETASRTTLIEACAGGKVNLEPAVTPSTPLDGHLVQGHVDGVGTILKRWRDGRSERFRIEAPPTLMPLIAEKGSIAVDGVSLTVNASNERSFEVNVVPYTLSHTVIDEYQSETHVNLEVDLLARYLARLLERQT